MALESDLGLIICLSELLKSESGHFDHKRSDLHSRNAAVSEVQECATGAATQDVSNCTSQHWTEDMKRPTCKDRRTIHISHCSQLGSHRSSQNFVVWVCCFSLQLLWNHLCVWASCQPTRFVTVVCVVEHLCAPAVRNVGGDRRPSIFAFPLGTHKFTTLRTVNPCSPRSTCPVTRFSSTAFRSVYIISNRHWADIVFVVRAHIT